MTPWRLAAPRPVQARYRRPQARRGAGTPSGPRRRGPVGFPSRLGVTPDQTIDVTQPETMTGLVEAIIRHENGQQPYAREVILAGVDMGLGRV
ncbi:hypothetical protein MTBSS4_460014 [Magnetospirillum sp. SS-4]|nr:hypothetical protein MTBSS4_460014 [Magnetospirillum sp. SS-4]